VAKLLKLSVTRCLGLYTLIIAGLVGCLVGCRTDCKVYTDLSVTFVVQVDYRQGEVTSQRLSTVGRRAFAVHGPMVSNSLPDDLRAQQDYEYFRQGLKTWLFSRYTIVFSALETFVIIALY